LSRLAIACLRFITNDDTLKTHSTSRYFQKIYLQEEKGQAPQRDCIITSSPETPGRSSGAILFDRARSPADSSSKQGIYVRNFAPESNYAFSRTTPRKSGPFRATLSEQLR
jgi:hypothetical protein